MRNSHELYLKEMAESGYNLYNIGDFHKIMVPYLLKKYEINKNELVVDLGAGQGHCLIPLFEQGWKNLVAVDIEELSFWLLQIGESSTKLFGEIPLIIIHTIKKV